MLVQQIIFLKSLEFFFFLVSILSNTNYEDLEDHGKCK